MNPTDLRAYVDRCRALRDASPPTSRAETRSWLVDPLLVVLGWDVRAEACRDGIRVGDCRLEYVLSVGSTPALFVAVEPCDAGLGSDRARAIQAAMARAGVDRAVYTDGASVALFAGEDTLECRLESLPDRADALVHFSRSSLEARLERDSRSVATRRLAVERDALADAIAAELASIAGEDFHVEFRTAAGEFLDRLVDAFSGETAGSTDEDGCSLEFEDSSADDGREPSAADVERRSNGASSHVGTAEERSLESAAEDGPSGNAVREESEDAATDEPGTGDSPGAGRGDGDGEYVVRLFADRGSIGAVGHSSPEAAMVEAARFLFERGLTGVRTPWPEEGLTVLNDAPTLADGSPMPAYRELPNGLYLNTAGDPDEQAARVAAMAERAGLRAMVTGDWSVE